VNGIKGIHQLNIIHRDLKSDNIFLNNICEEMTLKIGNMGVSTTNKIASTLCRFFFFFFIYLFFYLFIYYNNLLLFKSSPLNMAPEIFADNEGGYSAAVDIWSFGIILFEMLYGFYLFISGFFLFIIFFRKYPVSGNNIWNIMRFYKNFKI
jgi:serine/threonine protein kinase